MLAHRKQGPVLPTLVINVVPDPALDKARKRRSSRTTGFTASKETGPTTLLFRSAEDSPTLQEWARFIQQLIQPHVPERAPLSPVTPASPTFINPFSPRPREPSDSLNRPDSRNSGSRPGFFRAQSTIQSGRDRPMTFSDSPSLRSKRSDISSQTNSMIQTHIGYHNYTSVLPGDLPSPATTVGEYQGEFIEGWTSAQGRSSTLSSPARGRDSIGSQTPAPLQPILDSGSAPGPRETILDRAFQLRCIPGSEREIPGEEKLSSLARFDALMREMDEKKKQREAETPKPRQEVAAAASTKAGDSGLRSVWDSDSDSDTEELDEEDDDSDGFVGDLEGDIEARFSVPPTSAQRALNFIAGRDGSGTRPRVYSTRGQPAYNEEALMALSSAAPTPLRPQTGYSGTRSRPGMAQRTHSQPQLTTIIASSPTSQDGSGLLFPTSAAQLPEEGGSALGHASPVPGRARSSTEHRRSASSAKRLSFGEFTRRLSSTSSLLLVQPNTSGASSRASNSDLDTAPLPQQPLPQPSHHLHPRAAPPPPQHQQPPLLGGERERCGWRGSVGVFGGGENGFL
jgi:hypothetical protein